MQAEKDILGKLPPQAVDIEEAVLGALMIESEAMYKAMELITTPKMFYKQAHQIIYQAALDLFNASEPIDILTITNRLKKSGKLEDVGGAYHITELTNRVNSSANIESHCRIIVEMAIKRQVITIGSDLTSQGYSETSDPFDILDKANSHLMRVQDYLNKKRALTTQELANMSLQFTAKAKESKGGITGVPSKHLGLNKILGGYQNSDLIILAARPGMGKTAFALNEIAFQAIKQNIPTAIFSMEMAGLQLMQRIQASECELELEKIRRGTLSNYEFERLMNITTNFSNKPLFIDDTPALKMLEFKVKLRKLVIEHGVKLVVVDYLQLFDASDQSKNRNEQIGYVSRTLKRIAKEFDIPIIALSQLSRAVEQRGGDKRPQLSDLRDSGEIEQDADIVIFLYRPEYYNIMEDADGFSTEGKAIAIIAKNRNGSLDDVTLNFVGKFQKFYEDGYFEKTNYFTHKVQDDRMAPQREVSASSSNVLPYSGLQSDGEQPF